MSKIIVDQIQSLSTNDVEIVGTLTVDGHQALTNALSSITADFPNKRLIVTDAQSNVSYVDLSSYIDDTNDYVTSAEFNELDGNLTLTRDSGGTIVVNLDDRYLQSFVETNDLTAAVTWSNVPDANITQSSVTQHQAALSITESQISDLQSYLTTETDPVFSAHTTSNIVNGTGFLKNDGAGVWSYDNSTYLTSETSHADVLVDGDFATAGFMKTDGAGNYTVDNSTYLTSFTETNDLTAAVTWANVPDANITESSVTQHQAALSITESQISDLQSYATETYVNQAVSDLVASAPATLDTLNELAAALGDDPNYATSTAQAIGTKITTDSDASLNSLSTGGLTVDSGVTLNGGISSIGNVGDRYSITTGGANSLYISNISSPPYSLFEVNNNHIRFINGSSGSPITLTEKSIAGVGMSINSTSGYFVNDEGGNWPDNNGFVKISSTSSEFRTHYSSLADNSSKIKIDQNPTNGSAVIQHEGIHSSATFTITTNKPLRLISGSDIDITAGGGFSTVDIDGYVTIQQDLDVDGIIRATGDVVAFHSSDKRLKDNIEQIPNAIDKIQSIGGYSFNWNDKQDTYEVGGRDIGVVAQEIEEVLPELVVTRDSGYKAVKYEKIVALLIEGIKEQQEQINELKTKLDGITDIWPFRYK